MLNSSRMPNYKDNDISDLCHHFHIGNLPVERRRVAPYCSSYDSKEAHVQLNLPAYTQRSWKSGQRSLGREGKVGLLLRSAETIDI